MDKRKTLIIYTALAVLLLVALSSKTPAEHASPGLTPVHHSLWPRDHLIWSA